MCSRKKHSGFKISCMQWRLSALAEMSIPRLLVFLLLQTSPEEKVDNLCKSILLSACSLYKCIHSRIFYQLPVCSAVAICCETVFVWLDA